jgi:hypothetical protein
MAELPRCGTSSEDGASDFFCLLAPWRRLKTRGKQRDDSNRGGDLAAWFGSRGAGHLFLLPWWQFLERVRIVEPCGGFGGPCARERRVEWRVGGPRARERLSSSGGPRTLGCFGLDVLHAVGWSAWVQQHCGDGSCTAAALFGAVVPAPMLLFSCGSL